MKEALTNPTEAEKTLFALFQAKTGKELKDSSYYKTAFFEAFPENPRTFIRGEGKTVKEAEEKAWEKLQGYLACEGHEFERRNYKNGVGFCKYCNMFKSHAFKPLE
jgi:hypothetical protein